MTTLQTKIKDYVTSQLDTLKVEWSITNNRIILCDETQPLVKSDFCVSSFPYDLTHINDSFKLNPELSLISQNTYSLYGCFFECESEGNFFMDLTD